jgi:hypothetical protein
MSVSLRVAVERLLRGRVGEFAEGGEGARPVNRRRATRHQEGHADRLGRFLPGSPGAHGTAGMGRDAAITLLGHRDSQGDEFLRLGGQDAIPECTLMEFGKTRVHVGDLFAQVTGEGIDGIENGFSMWMVHDPRIPLGVSGNTGRWSRVREDDGQLPGTAQAQCDRKADAPQV